MKYIFTYMRRFEFITSILNDNYSYYRLKSREMKRLIDLFLCMRDFIPIFLYQNIKLYQLN
jgi:hypothetical protein